MSAGSFSVDGVVREESEAKHRVKAAALSLFSQRGFPNVSVRDIMNACGLTAGALYAHYSSKEEVLYSLIREGHERMQARLEALYRLHGDPTQRLARLSYVHMLFQLKNLELARVASSEYRYLPDGMRSEIAGIRERMNGYFEATLQQGVDSGVFDVPYPMPTLMMILAGANTAPQWYSEQGPLAPEIIAGWHATMAVRVAVAKEAAPMKTVVASALDVMNLGWEELRRRVEAQTE